MQLSSLNNQFDDQDDDDELPVRPLGMTTNEYRIMLLNNLRATAPAHRILEQNMQSVEHEDHCTVAYCADEQMASAQPNLLKETAETMYAATGDTMWLAF